MSIRTSYVKADIQRLLDCPHHELSYEALEKLRDWHLGKAHALNESLRIREHWSKNEN
jgi:hypothetical protein